MALFSNGEAYEHGATFSLALLVAYMITVLTQIVKDKDRFLVSDLVERLELQKIKIKLQDRSKMRLEER